MFSFANERSFMRSEWEKVQWAICGNEKAINLRFYKITDDLAPERECNENFQINCFIRSDKIQPVVSEKSKQTVLPIVYNTLNLAISISTSARSFRILNGGIKWPAWSFQVSFRATAFRSRDVNNENCKRRPWRAFQLRKYLCKPSRNVSRM